MTKNKKQIPLFKVFMPKGVDKAVLDTLHSGYIAEGVKVKEFTTKVASFIDNPFVVPVSSGTMALTVAYELAGVVRGDEVISTPLTCIATNTPLVQLGAKIVWADCEPKTGMIDPTKLEKLITKKTKAIVVLHKDGDLAKMDEILKITKKHNLKTIEDAAHTFGAKYKGKMIGNVGDYTCFSFQAIKHLTTGDGGAVAVKNEADYKKAKKFKWFGLDKEEPHQHKNIWMDDVKIVGYKGNMNDFAGSIGLSQIKYTKKITEKFHKNGELYNKLLKGIKRVELIKRDPQNYPVYWVYTLLLENRDRVMEALEKEGIASSIVHPRNDVYSIFKKFKRDLPGVDYYAARELSIPCGWWVTEGDIQRIVNVIKRSA
jgi:perosamine synthetase